MNKILLKAVMVKTKLRDIFLKKIKENKENKEENKLNYRKQWNVCVKLLRNSKKNY